MYKSITTWQAEEYEIEVALDGFHTIEGAASFGNQKGTILKHQQDTNYLTLFDIEGNQYRIEQYQVTVRKLKQESEKKLIVSDNDYLEVDISIREFSGINGLNGSFGSLAYGVRDSCDQSVSLESLGF